MENLKISYNTPVILNYTLFSLVVLMIGSFFPSFQEIFVLNATTFSFLNPMDWITLITHSIGHANFGHFMGNFTIMLLIGPMLEDKYGSKNLLMMFILTTLFTGILHIFFFSGGVLGASGNVFMVIMLSSFVSVRDDGKIPLTLILTFFLFMGKELIGSMTPSNIYHFGHIVGGLTGIFYGWLLHKK